MPCCFTDRENKSEFNSRNPMFWVWEDIYEANLLARKKNKKREESWLLPFP